MKTKKYELPITKIKATEIARIEGVSREQIRRLVRKGVFGDYWENPLRVRKDAYIQWQNQTRKGK